MPATIRLEWTDTGVRRVLTHLREGLDDATAVWEEYAQWLREQEKLQFESEGDYLGGHWAALSPKYAARKERMFPGEKILQATHRLIRSLTEPGGENIARFTRDSFEFGTHVPYFEYHQRGTGAMPARPPFEDYNRLAAGLGRIWVRHVMGEAATATGEDIPTGGEV